MNKKRSIILEHYNLIKGKENLKDVSAQCKYCGSPVVLLLERLSSHISKCLEYSRYRIHTKCSSKNTLYNNYLSEPIQDHHSESNSNYFNVGIVSASAKKSVLTNHIHGIQMAGHSNVTCGFFSLSNTDSADIGREIGIPSSHCYSDIRVLCSKEKTRKETPLDSLIILSPINTHYYLALEALENGFHVLCQSPLCITEIEAATLKKASDVKGIVFHVSNPLCNFRMTKFAKRLVNDGILGEIMNIRIESLQSHNLLENSNSDYQSNPLEVGVSDCTAELGKPVYRLMSCFSQIKPDHLLDDSSYITMELEGGAFASMCLSKTSLSHELHVQIEIEGSLGSLRWCNEQCGELEIQILDEPRTVLVIQDDLEFHGVRIRDCFSPSSIRNNDPLEGIKRVYESFFIDIEHTRKGKERIVDCVNIETALDSMLFLSCCVTSNLHFSSWVEMTTTKDISQL